MLIRLYQLLLLFLLQLLLFQFRLLITRLLHFLLQLLSLGLELRDAPLRLLQLVLLALVLGYEQIQCMRVLAFPLAIWESIEKVVVIVEFEVEGLLSRFLRWPVVWGKQIVFPINVGKHLEHEFLISCPILEVITQIGVGHR